MQMEKYEFLKKSSSRISEDFKKITGHELFKRACNHYQHKESRKDGYFSYFANLYYQDRKKFNKLKKYIKIWLKKIPSETFCALAAYVHYISGDYRSAKNLLLKAIRLTPENLDNWIDFAFTLRQLGKTKLSDSIIFYHDYVIYYYLLLNLRCRPHRELKRLILIIEQKMNSRHEN